MREKTIENRLIEIVEETYGGWVVKLWPMSISGIPDRLVLLPGGRIWFVELKAPGKKAKGLQKWVHKKLRDLGFSVWVIPDYQTLDTFIDEIHAL